VQRLGFVVLFLAVFFDVVSLGIRGRGSLSPDPACTGLSLAATPTSTIQPMHLLSCFILRIPIGFRHPFAIRCIKSNCPQLRLTPYIYIHLLNSFLAYFGTVSPLHAAPDIARGRSRGETLA
jgi:hypothetical protein